jgi:hypothetical protein
MVEALIEIAESLGYDPEAVLDVSATDFTGPIDGNDVDPDQLARRQREPGVDTRLGLLGPVRADQLGQGSGPVNGARLRQSSWIAPG